MPTPDDVVTTAADNDRPVQAARVILTHCKYSGVEICEIETSELVTLRAQSRYFQLTSAEYYGIVGELRRRWLRTRVVVAPPRARQRFVGSDL
jgi:hypothetical protein